MNIWTDINLQALADKSISKIAEQVSESEDITMWAIKGERKNPDIVYARHLIAKEAKETGYTLKDIADFMNRDTSTVWRYLNGYTPPT